MTLKQNGYKQVLNDMSEQLNAIEYTNNHSLEELREEIVSVYRNTVDKQNIEQLSGRDLRVLLNTGSLLKNLLTERMANKMLGNSTNNFSKNEVFIASAKGIIDYMLIEDFTKKKNNEKIQHNFSNFIF